MKQKTKNNFFTDPILTRFLKEKGLYFHFLCNFMNRIVNNDGTYHYGTYCPSKSEIITEAFLWNAAKFPEKNKRPFWDIVDKEWRKYLSDKK